MSANNHHSFCELSLLEPSFHEHNFYVFSYCHKDFGFHFDLNLLDSAEIERYQRSKNTIAKQCFAMARCLLKKQLANLLKLSAYDITLSVTASGKPILHNSLQPSDGRSWHFNIAHSDTYIVFVIAKQAVGIDVEQFKRVNKPWLKANRLINPNVGQYVHQAINRESYVFCQYWTALEAYVKLYASSIATERQNFSPKLSEFLDKTTDGLKPNRNKFYRDTYKNVNFYSRQLSNNDLMMLAHEKNNIDIMSMYLYQWDNSEFRCVDVLNKKQAAKK